MAHADRCQSCGAPLDPTGPGGGACPACLLNLALHASDDAEGDRSSSADTEPEGLAPGTRIGHYTIVRVLGSGGMGTVHLAEQTEPVERKVALKVIRRGLDGRQVMARFEAERQALARMDHPAIAKVLDAGATEDGQPWFAMEYVEGERITDHCDRLRLDTRARLDLFVKVCAGVQHAHQRGIIHRDLKPSNVLVAAGDGEAAPKIIDFGVAKAIEQRLTERSLFTELGVLVGTPEYMSPEQADLGPLDVDTRTDVYSLGVLLYELLTGELPFAQDELRAAALGEILRRIREDVPSRPSTRISEMGERARRSAGRRRSDPGMLRRELAGDLDVITMKALEKEPARRYRSPAELADDVRRHLHDEPVLARPPSPAYLLRKLVSRNKLASMFAAALFLTLVGFGVWMSVLYRRSQAHLVRALDAEAAAEREAETLRRVSDFLTGVFEVSDPGESRGNTVTARELLDGAAVRIERELADQPRVRTKLMSVMGNVYSSLGLYEEAEKLLRRAVEQHRESGARDEAAAEALADLASVRYQKGDYAEAAGLAREALAIQEALLGPEHPDVADTLAILGAIDWDQGRLAEATPFWTRCLAIREKAFGEGSIEVAQAIHNLGELYLAEGRHADAEAHYVRALEIREKLLGADHPTVASTLSNLAEAYYRQGRYEEAEQVRLRALETAERTLGPDHPDLAYHLNNLGVVYSAMKRFPDAERLYRRSLAIREAKLPPDHPLIAWTWDNLALSLLRQGKLVEAENAYERSMDVARRAGTEGSAEWGGLLNNFALLRAKQGRDVDAERMHLEALAIWERTLGPEHPRLAFALHNAAVVAARSGRPDEARARFGRALAIREKSLGAEHPLTRSTVDALAALDGP